MSTADRHRVVEELLPAYALGAADEADVRRVEAHLEECEVCREELAVWRRSAEALAASAEPMEPSPGVRERLLAEVGGEARPESAGTAPGAPTPTGKPAPAEVTAPRGTPLRLAAMIAFAAVALAALAWGFLGQNRLRTEVDALEAEVARLESRLAEADAGLARSRSELRSAQAVLELLAGSAPGDDVVLAGLETAPQGYGRLLVDAPNRRAILLAGRLPPLPEGRVYQLWSLTDGTPAPAGIFEPIADGTAIHRVDDLPDEEPDAWAVTLEPEGGVPQPTGPMVLMG